jgi:MFS family permease
VVTFGLAVAVIGSFFCGLTQSPLIFVIALGLIGLGYGLINLPLNIIAASSLGPERRAEAFSQIAASFFSGGTCGCLIGGLLADRFGFDFVFILTAVIYFIMFIFWRKLLRLPAATIAAFPSKESAPGVFSGIKTFLTNRGPLSLIVLCIFPGCASVMGLLNYYLPLRLDELGYGPAMAGRLNFMMSVVVIILVPVFGRAMDRLGRLNLWLVGSGMTYAMSAISYQAWPSLWGAVLAMVFLGLAQSITESGHATALLGAPEAQAYGSNTTLAIFSVVSRASQTTGPVILGAFLSVWGLVGATIFGGAVALMNFGYLGVSTIFSPSKTSVKS